MRGVRRPVTVLVALAAGAALALLASGEAAPAGVDPGSAQPVPPVSTQQSITPEQDRGGGGPELRVTVRGLTANPVPVSFCPWNPKILAPCSAEAYDPTPPGRLPIKARDRLRIVTPPAEGVGVTLERPNRRRSAPIRVAGGQARRLDTDGRRWLFALPRRLRGANSLGFGVKAKDGFNYGYVLRVVREGKCRRR